MLDDERAIAPLLATCQGDVSAQVRGLASRALMVSSHPSVIPVLTELARPVEDPEMRGVYINSLFGLCRLADEAGISKTIDFLRDPETDNSMRAIMVQSLILVRNRVALPLMDTIRDWGLENDEPGYVAFVMPYYLWYGGDEANDRLTAIASNPNLKAEIREGARKALGKLTPESVK